MLGSLAADQSLEAPAVSPLDALSEAFVHLAGLANVNTNQVIVVSGCLDHERLEQSTRKAMERIPLLRSRAGRARPAVELDVFARPQALVTHMIYPERCDLQDERFRRLLMDFSSANRHCWKDRPPIQVLLVQSLEGGNSCVYLSTHHGVADARSDSLLLRMIIDQYAALGGALPMPLGHETLTFESLTNIRPQWYRPLERCSRWLRAFMSVTGDFLRQDIGFSVPLRGRRWEMAGAAQDIGALDFHYSVMPRELSERLPAAAQELNVTINTVLCAALARLIEKASKRRRGVMRITCAVSLRKLIDERYDRSFRNYLVPSKIRLALGQSTPDLVRSVHGSIATARSERSVGTELGRLECLLLLLRHKPLHGMARWAIDTCQGTNACYSNPGRIEEDFSNFGSDEHPTEQFTGFGCLVPPYDFILYTPTINGQMQLDLVYRRAIFSDIQAQLVRPFLESLEELLDDLGRVEGEPT